MNEFSPFHAKGLHRYRWFFAILIVALLVTSYLYIVSIWNHYLDEADQMAIARVQSAARFLSSSVDALSGVDGEVQQQLREALTQSIEQDSQIARAQIYTSTGEEILPLVELPVAEPTDNLPLVLGPQLVRETDFVQVLAPITHLQSDETLAVLRVDFFADGWSQEAVTHVTHVLVIFALVTLSLLASYWFIKRNLELHESERSKAVLLSHLPGMAYRCKNDQEWTMLYVSEGCEDLTGYKPESLLLNKDLSYNDLIEPGHRRFIRQEWERILANQTNFRADYQITTALGEKKWVLEMGQGIYDQGEVQALEGLVIDITEQKIQGERIQYMNDHDLLTGLHNRTFYDQARQQMAEETSSYPISIIIADINGLKMINGAFGYKAGDRLISDTANIIRANCRPEDIVARTEGDEFRILLPNTTAEKAQEVMERILRSLDTHNTNSSDSYSINVSMALGTANNSKANIDEVENETEESLYQRKLLSSASSHTTMLSSIMEALYARSEETEEHCQRMADLAAMVGRELGLPQKNLDELELLAMLHDIGKIGIDDQILKKPGRLNEAEWTLMKKHPEIGYRIAMSSSQLEPIAPYILTHHEQWDGSGYPNGLQGEEIPLLSRIIAVVDAYDAMTEDRVYRKGMDKQAALEEIKKNTGTQFDPQIAELFMKIINDQLSIPTA